MPTATLATRPAAPPIPGRFRTTRLRVPVDGELLERLAWLAHAHGYADLEDAVLDLLTDAGTAHDDCPTCRRVARGGRPDRVP